MDRMISKIHSRLFMPPPVPLLLIKPVFQHQAQRMVHREMQLLDLIRFHFRDNDGCVGDPCQLPAVLSCEPPTCIPFAFAVTAAYITFSAFPEVLIPKIRPRAFRNR